MSRLHGKDGYVLLNTLVVNTQTNKWSFSHKRNYTMVACIQDAGERWDPGLISGGVSLGGFVDTAAGLRSAAAAAAGVDDSLVSTILPAGNTVNNMAFMAVSDLASFMTDVVVTDTTPITIEGQPDDGVDIGFLLHALAAETADGNGTGLDNTTSSAAGAVANLHVTAYSGFTSVVFKVQHSTDNSSWADLITFTTVTGVTQERVKTTSSTTVNRYLRSFWDVTGAGSATFAIAAARR